MHGGGDGTDRLAGRVLAMHAGHRLETRLRRCRRAVIVDVDAQPMHVAARARPLPGPTTGTLFSDWQATTQALQPMQTEASITIAQA